MNTLPVRELRPARRMIAKFVLKCSGRVQGDCRIRLNPP